MLHDHTEERYDIKHFVGRRFGLEGSVKWYTLTKVKRLKAGLYTPDTNGNEIALYASDDTGVDLVGFVTAYALSFKVTTELCGITMSKEIAFNELIFKKK